MRELSAPSTSTAGIASRYDYFNETTSGNNRLTAHCGAYLDVAQAVLRKIVEVDAPTEMRSFICVLLRRHLSEPPPTWSGSAESLSLELSIGWAQRWQPL